MAGRYKAAPASKDGSREPGRVYPRRLGVQPWGGGGGIPSKPLLQPRCAAPVWIFAAPQEHSLSGTQTVHFLTGFLTGRLGPLVCLINSRRARSTSTFPSPSQLTRRIERENPQSRQSQTHPQEPA